MSYVQGDTVKEGLTRTDVVLTNVMYHITMLIRFNPYV
jgi:hypothetical protein